MVARGTVCRHRPCRFYDVSTPSSVNQVLGTKYQEKHMVNEDIKTHMQAVLDHFCQTRDQTQAQLHELQTKLKEQNNTISSLSRELFGPNAPASVRPSSHKYARISVRWAILDLLNESKPLSTAEIADILTREGVTTKAENFLNNVSAVLSSTMKAAQEVQATPDGKWELTQNGKNAIFHIRVSPKFRRDCPGSATPPITVGGAVSGTMASPQALQRIVLKTLKGGE